MVTEDAWNARASNSLFELILEWPRIAPVFPGWNREPVVRTQAVARFPYRTLYCLTNHALPFVAFAHNRRKPSYWKDRVWCTESIAVSGSTQIAESDATVAPLQ